VALSFKRVMPDDVKPMLVLDASARARATYRHQAAATNDVVFLKYAKKWYDRVTIHVKDAPSGKGHFANNYHKVLEQVGQIINQNPHRKALVLHHKPSGGIKDTPRDLPNHLLHPENVGYCSWGQHNSTNEFFDKDLIVTASVLFHARSTITATGRTVSNVPADEEYEDELYQEMKDGELKNDLLQALSRGALRQCDGDQARDCVIYITAPKNREIRKVLAGLFPGATIKTDTTDQNGSDITGLTEREDSILWHLRKHLMGDPPVLTFPEVYKALNMNRQTLSKIAGRGQFNEVLRSWGYAIIRRSPPQPAMFVPKAHVGHWLFGDGPPKAEETHAGDF
jgi:hypothetical protein